MQTSEWTLTNKPTAFPTLSGPSYRAFLGASGMPAITAYYGLKDIVKAQPGETVVVSGAAGATGSMAVQIATKLLGCQVIGIAGADNKCA